MTHEILFRGKRADDSEWIESSSIKQISTDEIFLLGGRCWIKIVPSTVGRFTGLTDKNGRKIFEGDILEAESGNRGYVVFINGAFMKSCNSKDMPFLIASDVNAVIGNVFDNPELLKGEVDET